MARQSNANDQSAPSLVVYSRIRVRPDRRPEVVDAALEVSRVCVRDENCLQFVVAEDSADKGAVMIFELWSNTESLAQSFQCEEMTKFHELLRRSRAQGPNTQRFRIAS